MSENTLKKFATIASLSAAMLTLTLPLNAKAADDTSAEEIKALREQITLLQQRLDAIEAKENAKSEADKQAAAAKPAPEAPKPTDVITTLGKGSIINFTTQDKSYGFQIKARFQLDGHYFTDDTDGNGTARNDEFYVRRALITFKGTVGNWNYVLTPNLVGASAAVGIDDAWIEYAFSDQLHIWGGRFPTLEGWEMYQSNGKLTFVERGLPSNLTTGREIGLMATGNAFNKIVNYGAALIDGALDGNTQLNNVNLSGDMDVVGKITITPFAPMKGSVLAGLTVGASGSYGQENVTLDGTTDKSISYKTAGRCTFLKIQTGTLINGNRYRLNPQASYYYGPVGFVGEYLSSSYDMTRGGLKHSIDNTGWTAQASWVVTGENASANGVKPNHPFSLNAGGWGALELAARFNALTGDKDLFTGTSSQILAASGSVQKAEAYAVGLKWYLTENLLWMLDYENTDFSGLGADKKTEQVVMTRVQVEF
jgi:phosphate-selective porin OprO and OprP